MGEETGFDWDADCGSHGPADCARDATAAGETYRQYAEAYLREWPFRNESNPPDDLIEGMVDAMTREAGADPLAG